MGLNKQSLLHTYIHTNLTPPPIHSVFYNFFVIINFCIKVMSRTGYIKKSNVISDYFDDKMIDIIKQQFDLIDTDDSGFLDHDELKQLYKQLGFETSETEIQEMIEKCDKDKNGQVDFEEFLSALSEDNEVMNIDKLCDKEFGKYETESAIGKDLINAEGIFGVCKKFGVKISL